MYEIMRTQRPCTPSHRLPRGVGRHDASAWSDSDANVWSDSLGRREFSVCPLNLPPRFGRKHAGALQARPRLFDPGQVFWWYPMSEVVFSASHC
jgi:hypothetical protein